MNWVLHALEELKAKQTTFTGSGGPEVKTKGLFTGEVIDNDSLITVIGLSHCDAFISPFRPFQVVTNSLFMCRP